MPIFGTPTDQNPTSGVADQVVGYGDVLTPQGWANWIATTNACWRTIAGLAGARSFKGLVVDGVGGVVAVPTARTIAFTGGDAHVTVDAGHDLWFDLAAGRKVVVTRVIEAQLGLTIDSVGLTVTAGGASIAGGLTLPDSGLTLLAGGGILFFGGGGLWADLGQDLPLQVQPGQKIVANNKLEVQAGGITIDAGGLTVSAGGLTVTAGGLTVSAGGANITGGLTVATSNLVVTAGNVTASAGNVIASGTPVGNAGPGLLKGARLYNGGTAVTGGPLAASPGSVGSFSAVTGFGDRAVLTVAGGAMGGTLDILTAVSGGTNGLASSPTWTLNFPDGTFTNPPAVTVNHLGSSDNADGLPWGPMKYTVYADHIVVTLIQGAGVPNANKHYYFSWTVVGT